MTRENGSSGIPADRSPASHISEVFAFDFASDIVLEIEEFERKRSHRCAGERALKKKKEEKRILPLQNHSRRRASDGRGASTISRSAAQRGSAGGEVGAAALVLITVIADATINNGRRNDRELEITRRR